MGVINLSIVTCGINYSDIELTLKSVSSFRRKNPHIDIQHIVVCPVLFPNDDRIDLFIKDEGKGIYAAFNLGIIKARLGYIQILNAGDTLRNVCVGRIIPDVDFHLFSINAGGKITLPRLIRVKTRGSSLPHSGMWVKSNVYTNMELYRTDIPIVADFVWVYRNYELIKKSCIIHRETVLVNFELDGVSSKFGVVRAYYQGLRKVEKNLLKIYFFTTIKLLSYLKWSLWK